MYSFSFVLVAVRVILFSRVGKNVLVCDLSFRKEHIPSLLAVVNKLLILDHHKSAEKDLQDLPDVYKACIA
jgi:hypothetical protein